MPERAPRRAGRAPTRIALATIAASALLVPHISGAQEPAPSDWTIERLDERAELPSGAGLEVENLLGEIRVRIGERDRVDVHAVAQRHAKDGRAPRVGISDERRGKRIVAVFGDEGLDASLPEFARRRIDVAVAVPPGTPLRLRTASGLIEVKGGVGEVEAESESGDVRLWAEGPVRVRTGRGAIAAYLLGDGWSSPASFETRTGPIEVELPARADVDLLVETTGRIATDYSIAIDWPGRRHKRATGRVGSGGAELRLRSENGPIAILRRLAGEPGAAGLDGDRNLR